MPKKIDNPDPASLFPVKQKSKDERFRCLLDGNAYRYLLNVDYSKSGNATIQLAKKFAREHGKVCMAKREDTDIILWFRDPTEDEIKRSKKMREAIEDRNSQGN